MDKFPVNYFNTTIYSMEERDDSLSAFWEVARTGKTYLAERIGECVLLLFHFVGLICCILLFYIFVYDSQLGWAIIEKEAYAIIWALNRFREIVYGSHITVMCDHNPLQCIRECSRVPSCCVGLCLCRSMM